MFYFIKKKSFITNLLFAIAMLGGIIVLFFASLKLITNHNKSIKVPNVIGMDKVQAIQLLEEQGLVPIIQDSLYYDSLPKNSVLKQTPDASISGVKPNRVVYLTINRLVAPLVELPDVKGLSMTSAKFLLESYGLKVGNIGYIPDLGKDVVRELRLGLDTSTIVQPGKKIAVGTIVHMYLGDGVGSPTVQVPNLIGKSYEEVVLYLSSLNLKIGEVYLDGEVIDTTSLIVYKQSPENILRDNERGATRYTRVKYGFPIDIWLKHAPDISNRIDTVLVD